MSDSQKKQPVAESRRVKDNLFRYGAGTVVGGVLAGLILNMDAFYVVVGASVVVSSVAMILETIQERRNALNPRDVEDLQLLLMELTHEVKRLPPGYSAKAGKEIETKLEQLEQEVKTSLGQRPPP